MHKERKTAGDGTRQTLRDDFLGRDAMFVHQRRTGRLGWETVLPEGSSYSSYVLDTSSDEALLKGAYRIAKETLAAMDLPRKVRICINGEGKDCTDFDNVWVSTNMFDDGTLTPGQKADVFTGVAVHEGCHLMYTDPSGCGEAGKLLHAIYNVIEDERIERLLGEDLPGYANFLKMTKYYYYDLYERKTGSGGTGGDRVTDLFNAVLHLVRYPAALTDEDIDRFGDELLEARAVLLDWPSDTAGAFERARRIHDIIRRCAEEDMSGDGGKGEADAAPSGKGGTEGDSTATVREKLDRLGEAASILTRDGSTLREDEIGESVRRMQNIQEICDGTCAHGDQENTWTVDPLEDGGDAETVYRESLDRVRPFIPAVRNILRSNATDLRYEEKGRIHGKLDSGRLAEAYQGSRTVYLGRVESKAVRTAVCILLDESGSMACGKKMERARDAAVLLDEALKDVPNVDLYVFGHSADINGHGSVEVFTYRDRNHRAKGALGASRPRLNNADGTAIREAAAIVRKQTREQCLLFVISDGQPLAGRYRSYAEGIEDTRKAVEEVTRKGFIPVQVAIDADVSPEEMFRHWVTYTDLADLPRQLGGTVRKAVLKHASRDAARAV